MVTRDPTHTNTARRMTIKLYFIDQKDYVGIHTINLKNIAYLNI